MLNDKLLENLGHLGFPLMEVSPDFDVNETLAEVVKSNDTRLFEGFPVMLANAAEEHSFNFDRVLNNLNSEDEKKTFHALIVLSLALYQYYHLSFYWANELKRSLSNNDFEYVKLLSNSLTHDDLLPFLNNRFHSSRLKNVFKNYFRQSHEKLEQQNEKHEELALEYALSQLFSPKQKDLFKKKLNGAPLNKTEKEYYSRTVKKKLSALANPELHRLSRKLLEY